ncbi:MAG: hypothetical protein N2555_03205 [Endomicrobia bacterium]|nr:hypothetical protein [Endomicrobiia bacterium]
MFTITGLTLMEGTTAIGHYFLVWTSDEWFGKNNWSRRSNLAVWGLVAPDYVTDVVITSSASVSLSTGSYSIISWRNPADTDIPIEGVKIYWSTNGYTTNENYFVEETTSHGEVVSVNHVQLIPRHWYYYVLMSYNAAGSRPWYGANVTGKVYLSDDFIPPDPVNNLTGLSGVSEQDGVYISLNWTLPGANLYQNKDYYIDGRIEVLYSTTSFSGPYISSVTIPRTSTNAQLVQLLSYTTYYISVITVDGGGNKSTSTIQIYTPLDPYAPGDPVLEYPKYAVFASSDENIGSYVKFWIKNPSEPDLDHVRIYFSTVAGQYYRYVITNNTLPNQSYTFNLVQLYPRTTYYFRLVAVDKTNKFSSGLVVDGVYIDKDVLSPELPLSFSISLTPDAKPESKPDGSYVKINFIPPDVNKYRNFDLIGYEIYASSSNTVPYNDNAAIKIVSNNREISYYELLNLQQHTTYYVTLHSFDPAGNKSTSTVYTVFTYKDLNPPIPANVNLSTISVSLDPSEGIKAKLKIKFSADKDLSYAIIEFSKDENFADVLVSSTIVKLYPSMVKDDWFAEHLDCEKYYVRIKIYDWSGNVSISTTSFNITIPKDETIPLSAVGFRFKKNGDKLEFQWNNVKHQYNKTSSKIEKFAGVNNTGADNPTTFELYKYKVFYKQDIFNDDEQWQEVISVISKYNKCEIPFRKGYYKVVSYDICGNSDESIIVDDESNYYLIKNGVYTKFASANTEDIIPSYYSVEDYPDEEKGMILRVYTVKRGNIDDKENRIIYSDTYKFKNDNYVGVRYTIMNGKIKFASINKSFEINPELIETQVAFYVFDGKDYIRATTYVDKDKKVVYFKTKFLTKVQLRRVNTSGEFKFAEVKPRVITPDSSPGENDIVFFIFNNPKSSEVKIRIYDINSLLVWELITRDDSSTPGSYIGWDGKDFDGKYVLPGVYVYQIEAEGKKYKGTIVIAR